jgi:hypothetical protein
MHFGNRLPALAGLVLAVAIISINFHARQYYSVVSEAEAAQKGASNATVLTSGPQIAGCPILPADNVWNTPITGLKKDERSDAYVKNIGPDKPLHPNFGSDPRNGIPYTVIDSSVKYVKVSFLYGDESDQGHYPVPANALIEGGADSAADSDRHMLLIDKSRCMLFELGGVKPQADGSWKADAGIKVDLTSNALRGDGKTSTDAAGMAILPGLLRYDEVAAGEIRHAIRFTAPRTQRAYVWPARHFASKNTDPNLPPMGQRFRLRADVDISGFSKENQVILTALKRYGMLLSDNGSPWFIIGVPDSRWDDSDLNKLKRIKGTDFEAVDESDWQMHADSGRVDPVALK